VHRIAHRPVQRERALLLHRRAMAMRRGELRYGTRYGDGDGTRYGDGDGTRIGLGLGNRGRLLQPSAAALPRDDARGVLPVQRRARTAEQLLRERRSVL
jgi:hypothetical protein